MNEIDSEKGINKVASFSGTNNNESFHAYVHTSRVEYMKSIKCNKI